ncbi:hypothetical protein [Fibrella aquatica]|uniref:hypothetical protein n=1 Tax=Fibrella aquatica TaxID=3242487 RepID=UPI0035229DE7
MKKIELICAPEMKFSLADEVVAAADLTIEQAEQIAEQYPEQYVRVVVESKPGKAAVEVDKK